MHRPYFFYISCLAYPSLKQKALQVDAKVQKTFDFEIIRKKDYLFMFMFVYKFRLFDKFKNQDNCQDHLIILNDLCGIEMLLWLHRAKNRVKVILNMCTHLSLPPYLLNNSLY